MPRGDDVLTLAGLYAKLGALLRTLPPETPVWTEGCDCLGEAKGVQFEQASASEWASEAFVLITRHPNA